MVLQINYVILDSESFPQRMISNQTHLQACLSFLFYNEVFVCVFLEFP